MADLESLVKVELNGREVITPIFVENMSECHQIKNIVSAAHALAARSKGVLGYSYLKQALDIGREFDDEYNGSSRSLYA
jgi:hypothetical protein